MDNFPRERICRLQGDCKAFQILAGPGRFGRRQQNRLAGVHSSGVCWAIFAKDQSPKVGKRVGLRCMPAERAEVFFRLESGFAWSDGLAWTEVLRTDNMPSSVLSQPTNSGEPEGSVPLLVVLRPPELLRSR